MAYKIDFGVWGSVFAVPSCVVDKGLKLAGESQLKVLLYLLRHSGVSLTDEMIAQALSLHSEDVADAIEYWSQQGILMCSNDSITVPENFVSQSTVNKNQQNCVEVRAVAVSSEKPRPVSRATKPEPGYVAKRLKADKNLVFLMDEAQRILAKPFSNSDTATLVMLHDTDGLPVEVILMLLEHCVQTGKSNMRYIEKTGIQWGSDGIVTISLAEEKIKRYSETTDAWSKVCAVFGLHLSGTPTKKQLEYADCWVNIWCFPENMLRLAYERCVDAKGDMNLSYINGILKRWHEQSLKKPEDVFTSESSSSNKGKKVSKPSSDSASYDIEEYEGKSIFDD